MRLYGTCRVNHALFLITEFVPGGELAALSSTSGAGSSGPKPPACFDLTRTTLGCWPDACVGRPCAEPIDCSRKAAGVCGPRFLQLKRWISPQRPKAIPNWGRAFRFVLHFSC